jgi:hypothetical protein
MSGEPEPGNGNDESNIFASEISLIDNAIGSFDKGDRLNVALVTDPFAGQHLVIKEIRQRYADRITHLPFFSVVTGKDFLSNLYKAEDIIIMEKCHFLALRKVGGFAMLDTFLDFLASSDKLFITTWNSYSWSYLDAVKNIGAFFPTIVQLPRIDSKTLKSIILTQYEEEIEFIDDSIEEERPFITYTRYPLRIPFFDAPFYIPWIEVNKSGTKEQASVEDVIFGKIARIADGNLGVAMKLWERSLENGEMRVSRIPSLPCSLSLDINEAFLLNIILSLESIQLVDLAEIAGPEIDIETVLYYLMNKGLVEAEKGYYHIRPEALNCAIAYLKRNRMVW